MVNMVALIPARAGSKRVPGKNTRLLGGYPLIAWTIAAAQQSGVFESVHVCSDDEDALNVGRRAGTCVWQRDEVPDDQPDIDWVRPYVSHLDCNAFAILRPTSPFRTAVTIRRAYKQFSHDEAHSLRAMQPVKEHPGKMWTIAGSGYAAVPLLQPFVTPMHPDPGPVKVDGTPYHSSPTQTLPKVYIQNASLEMAWNYVVPAFGTISGRKVSPFLTEWYEGFDINTEDDWREAERLIKEGLVALPSVLARV